MSDHSDPSAVCRLLIGMAVAALVVSLSTGIVTVSLLFGELQQVAFGYPWMRLPINLISSYGPLATWCLTGASVVLLAVCIWRRLCGRPVILAACILTGLAAIGSAVPSVATERWLAKEAAITRDKALAHPHDPRTQLEYSVWLAREGNLREALAVAEKARSLANEHEADYEVMVGLLQLSLGETESALPSLRSAYDRREDVSQEIEAFGQNRRETLPGPSINDEYERWSHIALREVQHIQRSYLAGLILAERWHDGDRVAKTVAAETGADYIEWFLLVLLERAIADPGSDVRLPEEAQHLSPERQQWLIDQMKRWQEPGRAKKRLTEWAHGYVSRSVSG